MSVDKQILKLNIERRGSTDLSIEQEHQTI